MGTGLADEEQFGPYLVYERLGVGGMATVHRALERGIEGFERIVALKRLLPHLAEDASFIKSFVREAKLASLLNHVNIVQIFELGRVGTEYFISMEYIDGRDIRRVLRHARKVTGPPPIHVTVGLALQLCEALDYAHAKADDHGHPLGLVHRDVSPSNLLVTSAGHLKVIDFGIAKAQSQQLRTQTGRVKGKLAYMAPEAVSGKELDCRSDLFAAGVILHELLTARPLFASKNEYQTLLKVQKGDVLPPSNFNQACPPELDAICMQALERDPDDRWSAASEMRDALHALRRQYNLQTGHRDIAQWLTWAFSIEPPSSSFGAAGTGAEHSLSFSSNQMKRTPQPRKEDEDAVEIAWGGGEIGSADPVVLDEVPDVSAKHLDSAAMQKAAMFGSEEDDIPVSTPSHGHASRVIKAVHEDELDSLPDTPLPSRRPQTSSGTPQAPRSRAPTAQSMHVPAGLARPGAAKRSATIPPPPAIARTRTPTATAQTKTPLPQRTTALEPPTGPSSAVRRSPTLAALEDANASMAAMDRELSQSRPLPLAPRTTAPAVARTTTAVARTTTPQRNTPLPPLPPRERRITARGAGTPAGNNITGDVPSGVHAHSSSSVTEVPAPMHAPKATPRRGHPDTIDPEPDAVPEPRHKRSRSTAPPIGDVITARPSASRLVDEPRRPSDITIGHALIERRAGKKAWVVVAALGAAGAAATGITLVVTRGSDNVAPVESKSEPGAAPMTTADRGVGTVRFMIEPPDAEIKVVERQLDHAGSPWTTQLPAGNHQIQIQREGYKAWLTTLELSENETQTLRVVLEPLSNKMISDEATLILTSTPLGLDVLLDDRPMGTTPIKAQIKPGSHTIVLRKDGFDVWKQELDAKASANYEFSPSMSETKQRERAQRAAPIASHHEHDQPVANQDLPATDKPPTDKPATDKPPTDKPPTDKPQTDKTVEKPPEKPSANPTPAPPPTPTPTPSATPSTLPSTVPQVAVAPPPPKPVTPPPPTPAPTPAPAPKTVGPVVVPPTAVTRLSGETPTIGKSKKAEVPAVVAAKVCIDTSGKVSSVDMITKIERITSLDLANALKAWKYAPYKPGGTPTPACFVVSFKVK